MLSIVSRQARRAALLFPCILAVAAAQPGQPVQWKPFFTLAPEEGLNFVIDTAAIAPGSGVPVLNIANDGAMLLSAAGMQSLKLFEISGDGRTYTPSVISKRGPDGGFVYLPDGRTRFLGEEPAPGNTPQRHKSRIISWISSDGRQWTREPGIRYQPGAEDDSISSVPSVIQVRDSVWRMYYVGDFYRTNGSRTALSSDWGNTWRQESVNNILHNGDVDPQPVYLTDGRVRLYFRAGMGRPPDKAGIGCADSDDGLHFDTTQARLLVGDSALPAMFKLDPSVLKLPSGDVVCYIGAAPFFNSPLQPKLIAAWDRRPATGIELPRTLPASPRLDIRQNHPNPFTSSTVIPVVLRERARVSLRVFDALGRQVALLFEGEREAGTHAFRLDGTALPPGAYFCRLVAGGEMRLRVVLRAR
ncbi:MAG: T9SS type A sorting domain-containing protein [Ignavibacteria bacterium]|nr:T9SS type A sorting domain-containing protein [Ignavibacteria bacterium]